MLFDSFYFKRIVPLSSPSCRLYEPEAGMEALRAGSGVGGPKDQIFNVRIKTGLSIIVPDALNCRLSPPDLGRP